MHKSVICQQAIACLSVLLVTSPAAGVIQLSGITGGDTKLHCCAPAADGKHRDYCLTTTSSITRIAPPQAGGAFDTVFLSRYGKAEKGNWTIDNTRSAWGGTLNVAGYQAIVCQNLRPDVDFPLPPAPDKADCLHGALLDINYTPVAGEAALADVRYVQRVVSSGRGCANWPADFIDAPPTLPSPFYPDWGFVNDNNGNPVARRLKDIPEDGCAIGPWDDAKQKYQPSGHFCKDSRCSRSGCEWTWTFSTYLAAQNTGVPGNQVTMHDGIQWTINAKCVPGPNPKQGAPQASGGSGSDVTYDPVTRRLSFSTTTLDTLNLNGSDQMDPAFASDPILGASVTISDFELLAGGEGAYVFTGGTFTIAKNDQVFFQARIPQMLVDDDGKSLFADNVFGVFQDPVFNLTLGSRWLEEYQLLWDSEFAPEFRACTAGALEPSLDLNLAIQTTAEVSAAYCVPEPVAVGLIGFASLLLRRSRSGNR